MRRETLRFCPVRGSPLWTPAMNGTYSSICIAGAPELDNVGWAIWYIFQGPFDDGSVRLVQEIAEGHLQV